MTSRRLFLLASILSLFWCARGALAEERALLVSEPGLSVAEQTDPSVRAQLQALRERVVELGRVPVIVGLRVPFAAEGLLTPATIDEQREEIQAVQEQVLSLLPQSLRPVEKVARFETIPFLAIWVTPEELDILEQTPEVISIQEDKVSRPMLDQSVPFIGGEDAWDMGFAGAGQTVAILDTGVDKGHPFLAGKVVSEACYSTTDTGQGIQSLCPGGVTSSTAPGSGVNCTGVAGCFHGTHVAGIAAGKGDDLPGVAFSGVAKDASLIATQVFSKGTSAAACFPYAPPCLAGFDSDIIKGLERVYALRNTRSIAAVNMSLGGDQYSSQIECDQANQATKSAIDNLRSAGIATVVASGNEGWGSAMAAPGCISSAVSVGSTTVRGSSDNISSFTNSTSFLNLLAPGSQINASMPGGAYGVASGTSMAAPHVAGAWAVLKGQHPAGGVTTLLKALTDTGSYIFDPRNQVSKPRINVGQALLELGDDPSPRLYSAVAPYARAVQMNTWVTAFAAAINHGDVGGQGCAPSLPKGVPGDFSYQTTDASNQLIGGPNTPVDIPVGATQNFLIAIRPTQAFPMAELPIRLKCANATAAPLFPGVNTFAFASSAGSTPDLVAIGVTPSGDGIVRLPKRTGTGLFTAAAINIGVSGTITATATDRGRGLPLTLELCETGANGEAIICGNSLTRTVAANETLYYAVFVTGTGRAIAFDPAVHRLFLLLKGADGTLYGATSVAVMTP